MDLIDHPILLPPSPASDFHPVRPFHSIENSLSDADDDNSHSIRNSSGPDEAVFDDDYDKDTQTRQSSPRTSDDDISELPDDSRAPSCVLGSSHQQPFTPYKTRSPFRNPSSVLALQLEDTTPPHLTSGSSPRQQHRYRLGTPSRTTTPRSSHSHHSTSRSLRSPTRKPTVQKEYPLVLLHVTLLPIPTPYSPEVMYSLLPPSTISNWKLLREKVSHTVLERGILIPHPRDDYDLLEERLLESLELRVPRILKCGHFHLSPEEEADAMGASDDEKEDDNDSDAGDADICPDCNRRIRNGKLGATGSGNRRWDIRIYAANGLMRAGAWGAAWREMERVDVEIWPWIEDGVRRELDSRQEEANLAAAAAAVEAELLMEQKPQESLRESPGPKMDEQRRREIYGEDADGFEDGFTDTTPLPPSTAIPSHTPSVKSSFIREPEPSQVSISHLLTNYLSLLLRDRKNIVLAVLGFLVVLLALRPSASALLPSALFSLQISPSPSPLSPSALPPDFRDELGAGKPLAMVTTSRVFVTITETAAGVAADSESTSLPEGKSREHEAGEGAHWRPTADVAVPTPGVGQEVKGEEEGEIVREGMEAEEVTIH